MKCLVCKGKTKEILDFGFQPICSHYQKEKYETQEFLLNLAICNNCNLIQKTHQIPASKIKNVNLKYSEPEDHLDNIAREIEKMVNREAKVLGISFKDVSLLRRLTLKPEWLHYKKLLGWETGVETAQKEISSGIRPYEVEVVIARHILEHTSKPRKFLEEIKKFVEPEGIIVFEVPSCLEALKLKDYTMVWEEHTLYFTPETFRATLEKSGFIIEKFYDFEYPLENSLVAICKINKEKNEKEIAESFAINFDEQKQRIKNVLSKYDKSEIAILGAGHLTCTFINIFELGEHIEVVIDDDPEKKDLLMPGSNIPIRDSSSLKDKKLCLLGVNPRHEEKVIDKHKEFKGEFLSIFPCSKRHLLQGGK